MGVYILWNNGKCPFSIILFACFWDGCIYPPTMLLHMIYIVNSRANYLLANIKFVQCIKLGSRSCLLGFDGLLCYFLGT